MLKLKRILIVAKELTDTTVMYFPSAFLFFLFLVPFSSQVPNATSFPQIIGIGATFNR